MIQCCAKGSNKRSNNIFEQISLYAVAIIRALMFFYLGSYPHYANIEYIKTTVYHWLPGTFMVAFTVRLAVILTGHLITVYVDKPAIRLANYVGNKFVAALQALFLKYKRI